MADWIPVMDRLPPRAAGKETSDEVLCIDTSGRQSVWVCFYEHQHKAYDYGGPKVPSFENAAITHWQPLPPPPTAGA